MDSSKEIEPPLITGIRLARMRDGNMGQAEEVRALLDILKGSENLLNIVNDTVWALVRNKKGMSQNTKRLLFEESYTILTDALERFVDAKIKKIEKFIKYFQIMKQDVLEESKKLEGFEKDWERIQRELSDFKLDSFLNMPANDSFDKTNQFKNNVLQTSLPILERLTELENQMQKRVLNMIAFIAQANTVVDTNELYRLLTGEP